MIRAGFLLGVSAVLLAITQAGSPSPAEAGVACSHSQLTEWPVPAGGNGHFYRVVCAFDDEIVWDDADVTAESLGGTLATLTSEDENTFVAGLLGNRSYWYLDSGFCTGPFIGLFEPGDDAEPDGGWEWVTGEPFAYENWAPGEPNNFGGDDENRAIFGNSDCGLVFEASDEWHDTSDDGSARAFVVEFESRPACESTPVTQWRAEDGGNGHYYRVYCSTEGRITWDQAQAAAEVSGGHLVTNTSAEENTFVFGLADDPGFWNLTNFNCVVGPWLGGLQPPGSSEPGGGWEWVTDEPFTYTNWDEGEPDNFDDDDRIIFWGGCGGGGRSAFWIDLVGDQRGEVTSYAVEWETAPPVQGDINCDGTIDDLDMMLLLEYIAGTNNGAQPAPCPDVNEFEELTGRGWGDVSCDDAITGWDALFILLFWQALPTPEPAGQCYPVGDTID